jgi:hypothetical protein
MIIPWKPGGKHGMGAATLKRRVWRELDFYKETLKEDP